MGDTCDSKLRNMTMVSRRFGHVEFDDSTLLDMALTTGAGKRYLNVQHSNKGGMSVFDV